MALKAKEYPNSCAACVGTSGRFLLSLPLVVANVLVSLWKESTDEREYRHENGPCYERYVLLTVGTPILLALFVLSAIPAFFGLLIYTFSYKTRHTVQVLNNPLSQGNHSKESYSCSPQSSLTLSIISLNACLLPTFLAKFNNLSATRSRAKKIGGLLKDLDSHRDLENSCYNILEAIPSNISFACVQEVFDRVSASLLADSLKDIYPSIIRQADGNRLNKVLNSGLFAASKYPVSAAEFKSFSRSSGADSMADKGVLMFKFEFPSKKDTHSLIGYGFVTHLQAQNGTEKEEIRLHQLCQVKEAITNFKSSHSQKCDVVVMDFLCGDLNTVWDETNCLYAEYVDICKYEGSASWSEECAPIGTEMVQSQIHQEYCKTAQALKQSVKCTPTGDDDSSAILEGDGRGRQIDYILIHKSLLESKVLRIRNYSFVTAFAGLTDHLSVYAAFDLETCNLNIKEIESV